MGKGSPTLTSKSQYRSERMPGAACVCPQRWPGRTTLRKGGPEGPGGKNIKNILIYFSLVAPGKILKLQASFASVQTMC